MSASRLLRVVIAALVSLALVGGTASASSAAAPSRAAESVQRAEVTNCASATGAANQAKVKMKKAQKALNKAKKKLAKAEKKKSKKKIKKAKKQVKKAQKKFNKAKKSFKAKKATKARVCKQEQATEEANALSVVINTLINNPVVTALPEQVRTPLLAALNTVIDQLDVILGQIPGSDAPELDAILGQLDSLDPSALEDALTTLQGALDSASGGDPAVLVALIEALLGELPVGTVIPGTGDLADIGGGFGDLETLLGTFDPSNADQVTAVIAQIQAAAAALTGAQAGLADLLAPLNGLNGGTLPTDPAAFADILGTAFGGAPNLPFTLPTNPLAPGAGDAMNGLDSLFSALSALGGGAGVPDVSNVTTLAALLGLDSVLDLLDLLGLIGLLLP